MADDDRDELSRWQLPLRPADRDVKDGPAPSLPPITLGREPERAPERTEPAESAPAPESAPPAEVEARSDEDAGLRPLETPDVTARFVVAQLAELNENLATLTEATTERTTEVLEGVQHELDRITTLREIDLTEQAAGIFAAVEAGTAALERFSAVVTEVTDDLRVLLRETLAAIGGTNGLAEIVVQGATDLAETRSELVAGINRIHRDLATLRKRVPLQQPKPAAAAAQISDEQVVYIVEAVTEAVVAALHPSRTARRRTGA